MNLFWLKMPPQVCSGASAMESLAALVRPCRKAVILTDAGVFASGALAMVLAPLEQANVAYCVFRDLPAEPTCEEAQAVIDRFRAERGDVIVAVGGGSVMDIAKLVAAAGEHTVRELLQTPALAQKTVRTIMIPTTAGTGAEATPNSIVAVPEQQLKVGIVSDAMIADSVILDGRMLRSLPRHIAAATGVDALCHAIECYTSAKATAFSDLFAMQALRLIFANLEQACELGEAVESKNNMLLAAFYAGVAITCSGTTAVHALSYPLGGRYHIPHGVANAMLLLPVLRFNEPVCAPRFAEIAQAVGGPPSTDVQAASSWLLERVAQMLGALAIPTSLAAYDVTQADLPQLVAAGMEVKRLLDNNLRPLTAQDAEWIYKQVL